MFGCLGRLGCLVMLALLAAAGYFTKDLWYPRARALLVAEAPAASVRWMPITAEAGANGTRIAARLGEKNGPVFADLSPAEFVAWMMVPAMKILGTSAGNPEASVRGDTLFVRSSVSITELGDATVLGPLANVLDGRQSVMIGGRLEAVRPGLVAFHVTQMTVKELKLPQRLIDKIVQRISVQARSDSLATGAVPLSVPKTVGDVRITKGHVVLYKVMP